MKPATVAAIVLAAGPSFGLGGCEPQTTPRLGPGSPAAQSTVALAVGGDEDLAFAAVDGGVIQSFAAEVTAAHEQKVVRTGFHPGEDQGKVLVFDADGTRALDYALPRQSPFPLPELQRRTGSAAPEDGCRRHVVVAGRDQVLPFTADGRRFLLIGACGRWAPSPLVLLEFDEAGRSYERLVFWNFGSIRGVFRTSRGFGFTGVNNDLDREHLRRDLGENYATVLALFDLPPRGSGAAAATIQGRCPIGSADTTDVGSGYAYYLRLPIRQLPSSEIRAMPTERDGAVVMVDGDGVETRVDLVTGALTTTDGRGATRPLDHVAAAHRLWKGASR
ncbi:MAG: hypothetical protein K8T90_16135 [Planctomycetes bacterium]|nr:hypothetical protein [Planctomycetota bacterium]